MTDIRKILKTGFITGLLAVMAAGLLSACGGAVGDATPSGINYSGLTTQATLTSDNDDAFGTAMLEGGAASGDARNQMNDVPFIWSSVGGNTSQSTSKNQLSALESMVQSAIDGIQQHQQSTGTSASLLATVVSTGGCGGNIDVSDSGGSITFNNYCTSLTVGDTTITTTMNGTMSFTYTGDFASGTYEYSITYSGITITIDDGTDTTTHYFSGTITVSVDGFSITVTYSTNFQREGRVFKIEDPRVTGTAGNYTITGRLYHPDYGYVDITTNTGFSKVGDQYCGGTLRITAVDANGTSVYSDITVNADCTAYDISFNGGTSETITW